ncbi:hypothetical protein [Novosphingobium sp. B 225]|uniref:hypothetical protein n=1 Tax=Novosphingobium sp. B 225 TaxID=1961849 RepID=UPI000B4AA390|nr:hypothetical protein [Novosphingobium sp. B 225]
MSWVKSGMIVAALGALVLPGMAMAGIVVASSGPSARQYPAGKKIDVGTAITLQAGDSVTVLDQKGTRVLRGPGTMALGKGASPATGSVFAALTRQRSTARVRTGAVRNGAGSGRVRSPNLWYVDLAASGPVCVVDPANVRVWRANSSAKASYGLKGVAGSMASASFAAGDMVAPWDGAKAPVSDGASYAITDSSGKQVAQLRFVVLPAAPTNSEDTAALLIDKGCQAQLDLLAASLTASG